jgi:predicted RNA binding protein YcfA (HicA-like mRNA interferase family)
VSRKQKLREKILNGSLDANITTADLASFLVETGFSERGGKGSHRNFCHTDVEEIVTMAHSKDGKAKRYLVRFIREIVERYSL